MHVQLLPRTPVGVHETCSGPSAPLICKQGKLGTYPYFGGFLDYFFFFCMLSLWTNKLLPACVHVPKEPSVLELISAPLGQSSGPCST